MLHHAKFRYGCSDCEYHKQLEIGHLYLSLETHIVGKKTATPSNVGLAKGYKPRKSLRLLVHLSGSSLLFMWFLFTHHMQTSSNPPPHNDHT